MRQANEPFRFSTRLSLTVAMGARARSLQELVEGLRSAPESVVYQHTHRYLQQHQTLVPEPPNDFAYWATHVLGDEKLGERLASIDTVRFHSLADIRQALLAAMEDHLAKNGDRSALDGKEFHFMRCITFSLPTPHTAFNLGEFVRGLKAISTSSLYHHVFEARLRPPHSENDFSLWLRTQLGETELAQQVLSLDPYTQTLEGLRARIVSLVNKRLEVPAYAQA